MKVTIKDNLWYELVNAKKGEYYLSDLLLRQNKIRNFTDVLVLVFATLGVLGSKIPNTDNWIPIGACIIVAISQLIPLLNEKVIPSKNTIDKTNEIRAKKLTYFNHLERFWHEYENGVWDELSAIDNFYKLRLEGEEIENLDNSLYTKPIKSLSNKADKEAKEYIQFNIINKYNNENEQPEATK